MTAVVVGTQTFTFTTSSTAPVKVEWGDGAVDTAAAGFNNWSHTYSAGTYMPQAELTGAGQWTNITFSSNSLVTTIDCTDEPASFTGNFGVSSCSALQTVNIEDASNYSIINIASNAALASIAIPGYRGQTGTSSSSLESSSFSSNNLNSGAINALFDDLGTAFPFEQVIVSGNPGAATCNPSIATSKGWAVRT